MTRWVLRDESRQISQLGDFRLRGLIPLECRIHLYKQIAALDPIQLVDDVVRILGHKSHRLVDDLAKTDCGRDLQLGVLPARGGRGSGEAPEIATSVAQAGIKVLAEVDPMSVCPSVGNLVHPERQPLANDAVPILQRTAVPCEEGRVRHVLGVLR